MLTPTAKKRPEKRLVELFERLPAADRDTLIAFAEFLASRAGPLEEVPQQPLDIPRPAEESVVAAMRRLRTTYPMIDHSKMLHEASGLMAQHMMHGREAAEVIDELEAMFRRHFEQHQGGD